MTKLERMINSVCHEEHEGDPFFENFEYDPKEGHYHIEPYPPIPFCDHMAWSDNPATVHFEVDDEVTIEELKEFRDWLNEVLVEDLVQTATGTALA